MSRVWGSGVAMRWRVLALESLEKRTVSAADGRPALQPLDTNNDGGVSPLDALIVINALNSGDGKSLADRLELDTNGDGDLTPIDALLIINFLNSATDDSATREAVAGEASF